MRVLLTTEIVEVDNGVLLTIKAPANSTPADPLAERGYIVGPTYYPTFEEATAAIPDVIAVRVAREALKI